MAKTIIPLTVCLKIQKKLCFTSQRILVTVATHKNIFVYAIDILLLEERIPHLIDLFIDAIFELVQRKAGF